MSTDNHDTGEAAVAFAAGILIGFAATLLFVRVRSRCATSGLPDNEDYHYDGGDLFI